MGKKLELILTKDILFDEYVNKKKSSIIIAKEYKCGRSTVGRLLIKYGISRRTRADYDAIRQKNKKIYYCIYCQKEISYNSWNYGSKLCYGCWKKERKENCLKPFKCIDCGNNIRGRNKKVKRCLQCYRKIIKVNDNFCIDCGKKIGKYQCAKRCSSCNIKYRFKMGMMDGFLNSHKNVVFKHKNILTKEFLEEQYIKNKKSAKKIQKMVNINNSTVLKYLRIHGIPIRDRSESKKGFKCSEKRKELYTKMFSGKGNPNWHGGKIKVSCIICGKDIFKDKNETIDKKFYICSKKCRSEYCLKYFKGEGNPSWLGGLSHEEYPWYFNKELKEKIRKRDNHTCQKCGISEEKYYESRKKCLDVHHIDYIKNNCNEVNLITLCGRCNTKANGNRNYWTGYYTNILNNKGRKAKWH